jgi:EAL and modified HD-GYP domain-containing signal transduction protein
VDVFIARHAIFDRSLSLFGYELLFRSCERNTAEIACDTASTLQVLANSLLSSGLEVLASNAPVFVNFGQELLTSKWTSLFPPKSVVIEILESVKPSPEVLAACQSLKKLGYLLALDGVTGERVGDELMELANFIKVDFRRTTREEQQQIARTLRGKGKQLVAEKVETHEEFAWACEAGYHYFQGFFFAKPTLLKGQHTTSIKVKSLSLLRELQHEELDFDRIESTIRCDISLTYKLFKYVNSAIFYRQKTITSIKSALMVMGDLDVRRWITLATLPGLASGSSRELVVHALVRAKFCEMLAQEAAVTPLSDAFLVGMFSLLNALVDRPLPEVVAELNLPASICGPLLGLGTTGATSVSLIYQMAMRYEEGEWDQLEKLAKQLSLPPHVTTTLYLQAIQWSNQMLDLVGSEPSAQPKQPSGAQPQKDLLVVRSPLG